MVTVSFSTCRELLVLLDATDPVEVELYVSYVVSKAKWSPKYDIRVFSSDNNMKVNQQLLYPDFNYLFGLHAR